MGSRLQLYIDHLDETFGDLVNVNSLNIWVTMCPMFAEAVRSKHSTLWDKNKDVLGENVHGEHNAFDFCGLMDVRVHKTCRLGSYPAAEGKDQPRRPDIHAKQRSARDSHHTFMFSAKVCLKGPGLP